jgi:hypothetical protein
LKLIAQAEDMIKRYGMAEIITVCFDDSQQEILLINEANEVVMFEEYCELL